MRKQTNTNNVIKTWVLLQTTGGKDEPNTRFDISISPGFLLRYGEIFKFVITPVVQTPFTKTKKIKEVDNNGHLKVLQCHVGFIY
jgi:hypothetical protein